MKTFLIFFALLAWLTSVASAQTLVPGVDPAVQQVITEALPAKYASYGSAIVLAAMILGRLLKALADGRGIKGWLSAIWLGTNSGPKIILAVLLCLLIVPSCTTEGKARIEAAALSAASGAAQGYAEGGSSGAKAGAASGFAKALQPPAAKQPVAVQP